MCVAAIFCITVGVAGDAANSVLPHVGVTVASMLVPASVVVVFCAVVYAVYIAIYRYFLYPDKRREGEMKKIKDRPLSTEEDVLYRCTEDVVKVMNLVTRTYSRTLVSVSKENKKVLRLMVDDANYLYRNAHESKLNVVKTLHTLDIAGKDAGHFYVQVTDYIGEITKALVHVARPAYEFVGNQRGRLTKEQVFDLMSITDKLESFLSNICQMLSEKNYKDISLILEMRDNLFIELSEATRRQVERAGSSDEISTGGSVLYLNILSETKTIVLQARNILKSQHYFVENKSRWQAF